MLKNSARNSNDIFSLMWEAASEAHVLRYLALPAIVVIET